MHRSLPLGLAGLLMCIMIFSPAAAAPANGVVGNGTLVSCNEGNLNLALAAAGTITFNCGGPATITLTSRKTIGQNTTLDGGGIITLTGNLATSLFLVNPGIAFTLKDLLLDGGFSDTGPGGAIANHGTLTLQGSTIQNSETDVTHDGGAIFSDGPVFISGSTLSGNNAGSGGALYANTAGARLQVENSTFTNNQAFNSVTGYGGAIWVGPGAQLTMLTPQLMFNQAEYGGALYISAGGAVSITAAPSLFSFFSNRALKNGGAINNQLGGSLFTSGVLLRQNLATTGTAGIGLGGGIYSAGPLSLHDTYFQSNSARFGGGLEFDGLTSGNTPVVLDRNAFGNNLAQISGGGLYLTGAGTQVTLNSSLVDQNTAKTGAGGGLYRRDARLTIIDSSIKDNGATAGDGGGLYTTATGGSGTGGAVQVLDSTITGNSSQGNTRGGGLFNNGAQVNLRNDTIVENGNGTFNTGAGVILSTTNSVYWNDGSLNCDDTGPGITSLGGNYSSDLSCDFASSHDETNNGVDPLGPRIIDPVDALQALVYYLPKPGSSIINTALPVCSLHDQRQALRPDACDKGAVEFGGLLPRIFVALLSK